MKQNPSPRESFIDGLGAQNRDWKFMLRSDQSELINWFDPRVTSHPLTMTEKEAIIPASMLIAKDTNDILNRGLAVWLQPYKLKNVDLTSELFDETFVRNFETFSSRWGQCTRQIRQKLTFIDFELSAFEAYGNQVPCIIPLDKDRVIVTNAQSFREGVEQLLEDLPNNIKVKNLKSPEF